MKARPDGDFDVAPAEKITFKVVRKNPPNKATINPRRGWAGCDPEQEPDDSTKIRTCTAPAQAGATAVTTIGVDFRKDAQGTFDPDDSYSVEISGSNGGTTTDTFSPPPVLNGNDYIFHVEANE